MRRFRVRLALLVLVGLVLAACAKESPPRRTPSEAVAAAAPALASPVRPDPAAFRVQPALMVRTTKNVRLYTGRTFYLPVADLPAGTEVEYVDGREGWLYVRTPSGDTGWLSAADASISDGRKQAITYRATPGFWAKTAPKSRFFPRSVRSCSHWLSPLMQNRTEPQSLASRKSGG